MKKKIILYNPLSGNNGESKIKKTLRSISDEKNADYFDIREIQEYDEFFSNVGEEKDIIVAGGDGTLSRFINQAPSVKNKIYYFPFGSGNDFSRDVFGEKSRNIIDVTNIKSTLPSAFVSGKEYKYLNSIGFGFDGYCCAKAEKQRALGKKPSYTLIALKALLFNFKPRRARIIVDGNEMNFERVYFASTMYGKFCGGGMKMAPTQTRGNKEGKVTLVILHTIGRLTVLKYFPTIFKGNHVNIKKAVKVIEGNEIEVLFDSPAHVQIDGEVIEGCESYKVVSKALVEA